MANEDLLLRQAPHSLEGEQAVLGSMLIDAECVKDVVAKLRPADFYLKQNREIFEAISGMFVAGVPIDGLTVMREMERRETYDKTVTASYLAQLMEITPTSANVMEYAKIVSEKSLLRAIDDLSAALHEEAIESGANAQSLLEKAEQRLYEIRNGRKTGGFEQLKYILPDTLDHLGELYENGGKCPGLSTGISALDRKINGLKPGNLMILAARPSMGKTALALNIALNAARRMEKAVAVASLEMSKDEVADRILSLESMVELSHLSTGELMEEEWERIAEATVYLSRYPIFVSDDSMTTVADIKAKCRRVENLGLVVIDYLQLIQSSGANTGRNENRQQVVSEMSRMLKLMAKDLNVPVLCLSQLSRANEKRDNKRPMLSDLRESGAIEQDADVVMFLYREGYYNEDADEPNLAECIIAKNRHGETGKVKLQWTPEYTMFSALEERDES